MKTGHERRSNSRDRRSNEREFRSGDRSRERDRDSRRNDRDRRNDFRGNNGSNSRWPDERSRSRDNDSSFRDNRRGSRDRNDRDKSLQDRLRDMASDGNRNEYNRRNESGDWRDSTQMSGNFQGNFMDPSVRNIRPLNMSGPTPLEDIRLAPMVMDNIRGPPPGMHRGG